MKNEAMDTIKKYFGKETSMLFLGERDTAQEIADFFTKGDRYVGDDPDMAILFNGICLAVEHFEFDCYKNNRSGSENRKESSRIERAFDSIPAREMNKLFHDQINGESSYEQYIQNITKTFEKHYVRIEEYKRHLQELRIFDENTPIKMAFLIEDSSPLGAKTYDADGRQYPIVLSQSKEFLALMRNNTDVDYVIACSYDGAKDVIWLIVQEKLEEYETNSVDYANMSFMNIEPQVLGFHIEIQK